jgi:hypothetical protein
MLGITHVFPTSVSDRSGEKDKRYIDHLRNSTINNFRGTILFSAKTEIMVTFW